MFDAIVGFLYQFGDASAFLVLCASGLAIIFGMMGVINLAHGEFIMAGAYMTVTVAKLGAPLPLAIVCGALFAGFIGILLERFVIRHLYGRPLDTIVATWGISLIASQGTLILLGPSLADISTPLGSVQIGSLSYSVYRFVLMATAAAILAGLYLLFNFTRFGVLARATIQVPAHGRGARRQHAVHLQPDVRDRRRARRRDRRPLRANHDARADDGRPVHHRSLRHRRHRRRRCFRGHCAGRRDPRLHPGRR